MCNHDYRRINGLSSESSPFAQGQNQEQLYTVSHITLETIVTVRDWKKTHPNSE